MTMYEYLNNSYLHVCPDDAIRYVKRDGDILTGEWIDDLRSGHYSQTANWLHRTQDGGYCCVGVACETSFKALIPNLITNVVEVNGVTLNVPSHIDPSIIWDEDSGEDAAMRLVGTNNVSQFSDMVWTIMDQSTGAPIKVTPGAAATADMPSPNCGFNWQDLFTRLNDTQQFSFEQIADFTETHLGRYSIITLSRAWNSDAGRRWDTQTGHELAPVSYPPLLKEAEAEEAANN